MAIRKKEATVLDEGYTAVPPPVKDGYDFVQSLGGIVDELMGHSRDGKASEPSGMWAERPLDDDPEPIAPPAPVPGGDEEGLRNSDPDDLETK